MKALLLNAPQKSVSVHSIPPPTPGPKDLLIRVHYVALNPVDALYTAHPLGKTGRVVGSDFAGVVEGVGSDVPVEDEVGHVVVGSGDRVAGFLQGACSVNELAGAFAEYLTIPFDLVWAVPGEMGLAQAAAVSLCGLTAAQALFFRLGLPAPFAWGGYAPTSTTTAPPISTQSPPPLTVLIYGASTSVGLYAAQLLRLAFPSASLRLLGAASSPRHARLKNPPYSYDYLVDYRDADWSGQIRSFCCGGEGGGGGVDFALDCISEGESVERVAGTLVVDGGGKSKGKLAVVRSREGGAWDGSNLPEEVEPVYGAVWEGLGEGVEYQGMFLPSSPVARAFTVAFYTFLSSSHPRLEPNPIRLMPGGLDRIGEDGFVLLGPGGMDDRGEGRTEEWMRRVSMEKLVYEVGGGEVGRGPRN